MVAKGDASANGELARAVDRVLSDVGQPTVWSMIMTVFGDAIVPRGGILWTGSLIAIMELFGFNGGVVRTALSRLVADGWLEGVRAGRKSYYRLTDAGLNATMAAASRIYRAGPPAWDGTWEVVLAPGDSSGRAGLRRLMANEGFGTVNGDVFVRPRTADAANVVLPEAIVISGAAADAVMSMRLAARAWDLSGLTANYEELGQQLLPLVDTVASLDAVSGQDALAARLIMIHAFRRVVLRDPDLPAGLLPAAWPGTQVRRKVAATYRKLLMPSEKYISAILQGPNGLLGRANRDLEARFRP